MDTEHLETSLSVAEAAAVFREVVKKRPVTAKMSRAQTYTPDFGPYVGLGGITSPDYAIAVELTPPNQAAGGVIVMVVEEHSTGSRIVVATEKNSSFSLGGPVRSTRKRLLDRLRSTRGSGSSSDLPSRPAQRSSPDSAPERRGGDESVVEISVHAHRIAEFLTSSGGSAFHEIAESCDLTLREVSDAIKELEATQAVSRRQGGVYSFTGELQSADEPSTSQRAEAPDDDSTRAKMSAAERIEKLETAASLLDRGLISQQDYDQLRGELLA